MRIRRIIFLLLFCLYIAAVAYLCFARPDEVPSLPETWFGLPADKVAHFLMFLPFPFLGYIAFEGNGMNWWKKALLMIGLLTIGFALALGTEQVQALLEYRSSDSRDLLADYSGLLSGRIITTIYLLIRRRK